MRENQDAVKTITGALALGFSLTEAVQRVLGMSLSRFGVAHGHSPSEVSMCLRSYGGRVYPNIRADLSNALGVTEERLADWIESSAAERSEAA